MNQHKYRQSRPPSVGSSQLPVFQRTNSLFKLSRASTNTNTNGGEMQYENQSLRTLDKIPSARASVTYLDKLWTQIDVLDDVKNMAAQVKEKGSFFNDKFNEELNKLKQLQDKLIEIMANQQFSSTAKFDRTHKVESEDEDAEPQGENHGSKNRTDKFKDFFGAKNKENVIYKKQNFDEMNNYVNEVRKNLEKVGQSMKSFDDNFDDVT